MLNKYYKINLHLLEPCNYHCKYCFAHFDSNKVLSPNMWKKIIDKCVENTVFPVNYFNLAGGEPLLYEHIDEIIQYISCVKDKKVSIITNGSLLTKEFIEKNVKYLDTIGISIDSFNKDTLIKLGRCTNKNKYLSFPKFYTFYKLIKDINPNCKFKINSVVLKINLNDTSVFKNIIDNEMFIDRLKILKADLFVNDSFDNSSIIVSDEEYHKYIQNNLNLLKDKHDKRLYFKNIVFEGKLTGGYIIVDANGYLVDDSINNNYTKLVNCLDDKIDISDGFKKLNFNYNLYNSRYNL